MSIHPEISPLAGQSVEIVAGALAGQTIWIEDWWDRVAGKSWMVSDGNPACLTYAMRERTPIDDEVLYGKIRGAGTLVHISTLAPSGTGEEA